MCIRDSYEDVEEINVIDDYTVSFKLKAPNVAFLDYMTMAILPKHLLEGEDMQESDFFRNPVGTGPYKLERWDDGQAIILKKNEDYFAGAANIDRIVFKIVTDANARALQLKSGELNLSQVTPCLLYTSVKIYDHKHGKDQIHKQKHHRRKRC